MGKRKRRCKPKSPTTSVSAGYSVVQVVCVASEPDFAFPWKREMSWGKSSGFVIEGKRVLTCAHSVDHYIEVMVKRHDSDLEYLATVLAIGTECDIAMLTVEDEDFWHGLSPVEFGDLPALEDAICVVSYPHTSDTKSRTSAYVSGIGIIDYTYSSAKLLGLQINTAVIPGNSGGPAFDDRGKCVGIAFQSVNDRARLIPTPIIMHFIRDYEKNGVYTGFPVLGIDWQNMENSNMREKMRMKSKRTGVLIKRVDPTGECSVLKPSDVICSFDRINVANNGTVLLCDGERIDFSYLVSQKYIRDSVVIKVLRDSKIKKFNITLGDHQKLIPAHSGRSPSYYIIAGLIFTTVSIAYLDFKYGHYYLNKAPHKLLAKLDSMLESPDEQLVVISKVLEDEINIGYKYTIDIRVLAFNDKPVKNLKSLASMVENCKDTYLKFRLEDNQMVFLKTSKAKAATTKILKKHCVPSAMSDDLKE
ncbi:hypothetical protein QN277_025504 [Acacia crassicarpa]|uniref:Protease Do-like PDZ domain-containing protein n=1 Tax=Acacia crassicarpa TaxID=499986 RepID=A0AAE1K555_9FABA|nr:hypothetical protein QN277_025504 [Acacia crassicarpa]